MRKIIAILYILLIVFSFTGCNEPENRVSFIKGKRITIAEQDCVAVFTKYTNESSDSIVPADNLDIKAYQNGKELPPIVPTGKTKGYIQCDTSIQSGITADVVWIFQIEDDSIVSVEMPDGETKEITIK